MTHQDPAILKARRAAPVAEPTWQWPAEGLTRIPAWLYTDPALFEREMEVFHHGRTWNYVGLECEIPNPGNYKRGSVGTRSVIATRDENGDVHVLENRCSHRGAPICWKHAGQGDDLTCPYHQWNFDLRGNLQGVPFQRGMQGVGGMGPGFDKSQHGLRKLRTALRGGVIWATFDEATPEFADYAGPELLECLDRVVSGGRKLKLLGISRQVFNSNWKTWIENARDGYHATLLHTFLTRFSLVRADLPQSRRVLKDAHSVGYNYTRPIVDADKAKAAVAEIKTFKSGYSLNDQDTVSTTTFDYEDGMNIGMQLFPSAMYQPHLNVPSYRQIVPKSVGSHEVHWIFFGFEDDDEAMTLRRLKQANMVGPAGFVTAEDGEVIVKMQPTLDSAPDTIQVLEMGGPGIESSGGLIGENPIRAFYDYYRRMMDL